MSYSKIGSGSVTGSKSVPVIHIPDPTRPKSSGSVSTKKLKVDANTKSIFDDTPAQRKQSL